MALDRHAPHEREAGPLAEQREHASGHALERRVGRDHERGFVVAARERCEHACELVADERLELERPALGRGGELWPHELAGQGDLGCG